MGYLIRKPKPAITADRATCRVLLVLLTGAGQLSGFPISQAAQVGAGKVYAILARLEREGWVASEWERVTSCAHGGLCDAQTCETARRPRRFYQMTRLGRGMALSLLGLDNGHV